MRESLKGKAFKTDIDMDYCRKIGINPFVSKDPNPPVRLSSEQIERNMKAIISFLKKNDIM